MFKDEFCTPEGSPGVILRGPFAFTVCGVSEGLFSKPRDVPHQACRGVHAEQVRILFLFTEFLPFSEVRFLRVKGALFVNLAVTTQVNLYPKVQDLLGNNYSWSMQSARPEGATSS